MDSGCSFHMCLHKSGSRIIRCNSGHVLLGNNKVCKVLGIGDVRMRLVDGVERVLTGVRHFPELRRNLIYCIKIEGGVLKVIKGSMMVMKGSLENGLYLLQGKTFVGVVAPMEGVEISKTQL